MQTAYKANGSPAREPRYEPDSSEEIEVCVRAKQRGDFDSYMTSLQTLAQSANTDLNVRTFVENQLLTVSSNYMGLLFNSSADDV